MNSALNPREITPRAELKRLDAYLNAFRRRHHARANSKSLLFLDQAAQQRSKLAAADLIRRHL